MRMRMSRKCMSMNSRRSREFVSQITRYFLILIHRELGGSLKSLIRWMNDQH
jgi:hypothetical protein